MEDPAEFEEWDDDVAQALGESNPNGEGSQEDRHVTPRASSNQLGTLPDATTQLNSQISFADLEAAISNINISDSLNGIANQSVGGPATPRRNMTPVASSSVTQRVAINITGANEVSGLSPMFPTGVDGRLSPDRNTDCPMTPRNDAGPFVLDGSGSAGRAAGNRLREGESPGSGSTNAPSLPPLNMD